MATATISQMQDDIKAFMEQDIPSFVWGPPGIGKTQGVEQLMNSLGYKTMFLDLSTLEAIDLRGLPSIDQVNKIVEWIPPEMLPNKKRDGKKVCLFLDEMNVAHPSIQAACMPLVLEGRIGSWQMHDGVYIVGAGNYQSNRASAQKMPTALASRFGHINAREDIKIFTAYANSIGMNPYIVAFLRARPELLLKMDDHEQIVFANPRSWERASLVCEHPDGQRQRLMSGLVGDGPAGEYEGFYKTLIHLPTIEDIIKSPKTARVPTEPDGLYAVSTAIARYADKKNFSAIMDYGQRLGKDFEIITSIDATNLHPELCEHIAFVEFAKRNQNVQI